MELIRPALGDHINGGETVAVLRGRIARINAYLGDGVDGRIVIASVVISRSRGSRAIRQKVDVVRLRAIDPDRLAAGRARSPARIHAGNELSHLGAPVGADDRRCLNHVGTQLRLLPAGFRFDERRTGVHHHFLRGGAELERGADFQSLDLERNAFAHKAAETFFRE